MAAGQGCEEAVVALDLMQERNLIPTPSPGTAVTAILLTSPAASLYNNRSGAVVAPASAIKPGRVGVLLEGETKPISFKLKNVKVA